MQICEAYVGKINDNFSGTWQRNARTVMQVCVCFLDPVWKSWLEVRRSLLPEQQNKSKSPTTFLIGFLHSGLLYNCGSFPCVRNQKLDGIILRSKKLLKLTNPKPAFPASSHRNYNKEFCPLFLSLPPSLTNPRDSSELGLHEMLFSLQKTGTWFNYKTPVPLNWSICGFTITHPR